MLVRKTSDVMSALKKLSVLVRNRSYRVRDIFCLVIKRPGDRNLLGSTSDSIDLSLKFSTETNCVCIWESRKYF